MTNELIDPSEALSYSRIYLDFLAGVSTATDLFTSNSVKDVAAQLDGVPYNRELLADILREQAELYGASRETFANIDRLLDNRAVCVFAGQQAGLFGGPLLTLIKALASVKAARLYSARLNRPVIPMFAIAGDDHDFEEINHTFVLCREMNPCKIAYETPPEFELPASEIRFTDKEALQRAKDTLRQHLGNTDFTDELYDRIDRAYTPDDTFVSAFGRFMAGLTREFGLVLFSPGDLSVKRHAGPFFRTIVEKQEQIHSVLSDTSRQLKQAGYHIQVEKREDAAHLFVNIDGRKPVLCRDQEFSAGDTRFSRQEMLDQIEQRPERFSPDVLTRPVFQSYLFPTVAQMCGPAEIAYMAQMNPMFDVFGLPAPYYQARPSATLVEARFAGYMSENDITFGDLTGDIEQVVNRVLAGTFPADLENSLTRLRGVIDKEFGELSDEVLGFDPKLKNITEQTRGKIDFAVKGLAGKMFTAHKKHNRQTRDRIYRLYNALYTNRSLQERSLNITYFLARYGSGIISFVEKQFDVEQKMHQLINLEEYQS